MTDKFRPISYKRQLKDNRPQAPHVPQNIMPKAAQWVPDVFNNLPVKPGQVDRVYILASGPNGKEYYDRVPKDAFTISVNSMVKNPHFPNPDIWMAMDHRIVDEETASDKWWENFEMPDTFTLFGARLVNRLYMENVLGTMKPKHRLIMPHAYWSYQPDVTGKDLLGHDPLMFKEKIIRGGLTVSGCATQVGLLIGAKEIILVGVDMNGPGHWDGFENPDPLYEGEWIWAVKFAQFCNRLEQYHGVKVYTLSPSKLERTIKDGNKLICEGVPRWKK
jgi:hypothetical protein